MRRHIIFIVAMVTLIVTTGCGKLKDEYTASHDDTNVVQEELRDESQGAEAKKDMPLQEKEAIQDEPRVDEETDVSIKENQSLESVSKEANSKEKNSPVVISKSNNKITSEEKEKALNDMSKEIDQILNELNNLDDITDEDLKF